MGSSSTSTVHAPHTPCSQPRLVPLRRRWSRISSARVLRAGTFAVRSRLFTVSVTVTLSDMCFLSSARPERTVCGHRVELSGVAFGSCVLLDRLEQVCGGECVRRPVGDQGLDRVQSYGHVAGCSEPQLVAVLRAQDHGE